MTFREKSAAVTLAVLVFVYGGYFWRLGDWRALPPVETVDGTLIRMVAGLIVLLIAAHIVLAILNRMAGGDETADERDRLIDLKGARNGGLVVGVGAVTAMFGLLGGVGATQAVHVLLAALVLGEAVTQGSKLVYYRVGA